MAAGDLLTLLLRASGIYFVIGYAAEMPGGRNGSRRAMQVLREDRQNPPWRTSDHTDPQSIARDGARTETRWISTPTEARTSFRSRTATGSCCREKGFARFPGFLR